LAQTNDIPRARISEVLDLAGLTTVARKRAGTFSLGMGQRLGIAAALLGDPAVLLLDEPVNGLDPGGIIWMRTLLKDLAAHGRTAARWPSRACRQAPSPSLPPPGTSSCTSCRSSRHPWRRRTWS